MDQTGDYIEGLRKLVDPRLGDNYSIDSINKVFIYGLNMFLVSTFYAPLKNNPYISLNVFKIPTFFHR